MKQHFGKGEKRPRRSKRLTTRKEIEEVLEEHGSLSIDDDFDETDSMSVLTWTKREVDIFLTEFIGNGFDAAHVSRILTGRTVEEVELFQQRFHGYLSRPRHLLHVDHLYALVKEHLRLSLEANQQKSLSMSKEESEEAEPLDVKFPLKLRAKMNKVNVSRLEDSKGMKRSRDSISISEPGSVIKRAKRRKVGKGEGTSVRAKRRPETRRVAAEISHILQRMTHSPAFRKWCMYEFFYASVDQPFFEAGAFRRGLVEMGLGGVQKMTRVEWSYIRSLMGKPRRLSQAFLNQERMKLRNYRATMVRLREESTYNDLGNLVVIPPIPVNSRVLVMDLERSALHSGFVDFYNEGLYNVRFDNAALGTRMVKEQNVMRVGSVEVERSSMIHVTPAPMIGARLQRMANLAVYLRRKEEIIKLITAALTEVALRKEKCVGIPSSNLVASCVNMFQDLDAVNDMIKQYLGCLY